MHYHSTERDIKACTCTISQAIIDGRLSVMYNMLWKTQLLALVGKGLGAPHLSLQTFNNPQQQSCIPHNSNG